MAGWVVEWMPGWLAGIRAIVAVVRVCLLVCNCCFFPATATQHKESEQHPPFSCKLNTLAPQLLLVLMQGGVCVGLVVRDHLMKLLVEAVKRGTCQHLEVPFTELNRQFVDASALESEAAQQMAVLEVGVGVVASVGVG